MNFMKHLSPMYDAATGFTGTAAPMAMMALGGKMGGQMGGNRSPMGRMVFSQMPQMPPQGQDDMKRRMLAQILMGGMP